MENNLSESEKSWAETIDYIKSVQGTREDLIYDCDGIELPDINFPFELGKIGNDLVYGPKQIDITAQEKHLNSIIDKAYEFVNEYCEKHNININELALQKNNRAITSDIHGDLFSMMVGLIFFGVNFFKNCFFYFDLKNNRFITRERAIQLINDCLNNDLKFINAFTKHYKQIFDIFYMQKDYDKSVEELQQLINQENPNDNFEITKQTIRIKENIDNTIHIRDKNIFKFTYNNENEIIITNVLNDIKCEIQLNIKDKNFSKSISASSLATSNLKQKLNEWIKKFIHIKLAIYVTPIPYFNPNAKGKLVDLGDSIDKGPESITCLVTYALLSQAIPNSIICLLGNHETLVENKSLQNFIEFCIEKKALRTGYIEKAIKDGQEIYYSYSHVTLIKEDLPNLFVLLYIILNIDTEKKFLLEQDIEVFTKHIKEKWPKRFGELPEELQTKVINFFNKNNLKQSDIKFDDPDDPNYIEKSHQFYDFYNFIDFFLEKPYLLHQILKNAGFNDIDFVELRNAVGDIIYNKYLYTIYNCQKFKYYINGGSGSFMHARRNNRVTTFSLFDNIYQHIGHDFNNFTLISKISNGYLIDHDVFRSVGYRKTESRVNLFISIYTNNFFIIDGYVSRNGNEISKESEIIIDDSISQIILHESDDKNLYKNYGKLKEHVRDIKNFTNKAIDENLIKKSLTENNEPEETKIMLTESKESWKTAINSINQKLNPETVHRANLNEFIMNIRKNDLNSLIYKIDVSAKYTDPNDLKENRYFSLIVTLIKKGIINLDKHSSLYFDLQNNEFISEEKYPSLICEKICESENAILLIYIFLNKLETFMRIYPQPYVISYFESQREIEANAEDIISSLNFLINKLSNKKFIIKEEKKENDKIIFSDENGNFISISKPNKDYQCIEINSKTNFGYNYKNEICLNLNNYFNEKCIDLDSYCQKIRDTVLNWLNILNLTIDAIKFYFEIPIPITQSEEKFICFLEEPTNVIQQRNHEEIFDNNEEFIEKLIKISDQKSKKTITCFMTLALTALSNPNIKFILSNYETTFCGNEYFAKIIDYCIEEKIFINGYVEEVTEDGKQIWHSYFHTIFTKKHLQKLFAILFVLIYIDKEIQRLNDCGKELSFYLENYLKAKWPVKLKELPKESQEKLLSFFDEHNLQSLKLNTWEDFLKMDWQNFYEILIKAKFTDIEFFLLKIIICEIFHNEYYSEANHIWKPLFSAITGKMNWLYHEEYIPQNPNETFSIIQHLGQYYENLPQNLNCFNAELIQLQKTEYNFLDDEAEYNLVSSSDDEEMDKIREEDLATPIEIIPPLTPGDQSELSEP